VDSILFIVMREAGVSQTLTFDQHADFQALMHEPPRTEHCVAELERGFKMGQDTPRQAFLLAQAGDFGKRRFLRLCLHVVLGEQPLG
jgi:hypothetical protein